uniref:Protein-tyrosine-phosphatase n=1 Tax=Acrobeloides nanus TaxID=290746 RepID=A0A914ERB0_9BILA
MSRVGLFGQISEINDHLYLSGAGVLRPEKIRQKKITCVINVTTEEPNAYLPGIDYVKIRIEDNPYAKLDNYFDMVADRIKSVKDRGGRTLVHCVAGVSRSASLTIIYLVKYERMSLRQAYHYVKSARPIIRPNVGFWKQMVDYERKLRGHTTVSMVKTDQCDLPIPDIYVTNDLRKHVPSSKVIEEPRVKTTAMPMIDYAKRRGLSVGTMDTMRSRQSAASTPAGGFINPWRHATSLSLLSPAPNRRPRTHDSIFGNLYNSSREAFFSAF